VKSLNSIPIKGWLFSLFKKKNVSPFEKLFEIFKELITYTSGDFDEAIEWLKELDKEYLLTDENYTIDDFVEELLNKGYINRNKILTKNGPVNLTIPLSKSSQNRRINQIYTHNLDYFSKKIEKTIFNSFCKRPFGKEALKLFNQSTGKNDRPIFEIAVSSIINTARYLSISKDFFFSSKLNLENFSGEKRIIEICKIFKATEYIPSSLKSNRNSTKNLSCQFKK